MSRKIVETGKAPRPVGPYSQAVAAGGFVFVSGQAALAPATCGLIEGDVRAQTERVLKNISAVLEAAGSSLPEFFLDQAGGRVIPRPNRRAVEEALRDALDDLPARKDRRVEYLMTTFAPLLQLPEGPPPGPEHSSGGQQLIKVMSGEAVRQPYSFITST